MNTNTRNVAGPGCALWRSELRLRLGLACQNLLGHVSQLPGLPNAEVEHDLLRAARHSHRPHLAREALYFLALASAGVRKTTEDLRRFAGAILEDFGALRLQQRRNTSQLQIRLHLVHGLHLEGGRL